MAGELVLSRPQVLGFRRRVGALEERLPAGTASLRRAAWAGLQDSVPRSALLAIHARVAGTGPTAWADPSLAQVWGPRYTAYVVAAVDRPVFTLGRLPDDPAGRRRAEDLATRLHEFLAGRRLPYREAGRGLGVHPNALRYAAPTGTVLIRWEGAGQPTIWTEPRPDVDPADARLELARRFLHVSGPGTAASFAEWAGIRPSRAAAAFEALRPELIPVRSPLGEGWILAQDEPAFRAAPVPSAPARLLPSGDPYFLLQGADRELLVPDADRRRELWPPRVWPGAVLVDGEVVGTWRRVGPAVTVRPWRRPSRATRAAVEAEAAALPLPDLPGPVTVSWGEP
ncbi:MAG TPA: crosslink repair DNA glycosylase YcaQ family protein [Natronosporangium sp.]